MATRAIIFANGSLGNPDAIRRLINPGDFIMAADGGTKHARNLGLIPEIIVGDLDSLSVEDLQWARNENIQLVQFPKDKDLTDLALAIEIALDRKVSSILIVAALGWRIDQTIGNLSLLNNPRLINVEIRLDDGVEEVFFTRKDCQVDGRPGEIVSLLPWAEEVSGISTEGLRWPLHNETLFPYGSRGISNELLEKVASIKINKGLLLVVHRRDFSWKPLSKEQEES